MASSQLSPDSHAKLTNSKPIKLLTGSPEKPEHCTVFMGLLAFHSPYLAGLLQKWSNAEGEVDDEIGMTKFTPRVVKTFNQWCYNGHLNATQETIADGSLKALTTKKTILIDLWYLGETYEVANLQNEVINLLTTLLGSHPELLTKDDVAKACQVDPTSKALRGLIAAVLVARIEDGNVSEETYPAYDQLAQAFPGFFSLVCYCQKEWLLYVPPNNLRRKPILLQFLDDRVRAKLKVEVPSVAGWVAREYGLVVPAPAPRPFVPNEVIELD